MMPLTVMFFPSHGVMEYWIIGALEKIVADIQYETLTPTLQYSNTPTNPGSEGKPHAFSESFLSYKTMNVV